MISPCVHAGCHNNQFTKITLVFQGNATLCTTNHQSIKQQLTEARASAVTVLPKNCKYKTERN
jgi:hypothetical protein